MREGERFVGPAGELHEVEVVGFERRAQGFAFCGVEALVLELDAVDFDAQDEGGGDALSDRLGDFDD